MNTPVNFKIAKLLKEKGFDKPTLHFFFEDGVLIENSYQDTVGMDYGKEFEVEFFELTDNWNKGWVKKKDGGMCFGCNKSRGYFDIYSAPTIAEVVMWLYEKHGIWISVNWVVLGSDEWGYGYAISYLPKEFKDVKRRCLHLVIKESFKEGIVFYTGAWDTPTEAYEAAIEYCLTNLI